MHSAWSDNYSTKSTPDRSRSRRTWRNPMPIVRRSRKYRAIIGRRCEAYAPLTSGYNGLVGGSNPLGPTTQSYATGDFLKVYERPRIGGDLCDGSFSETASLQSADRFAIRGPDAQCAPRPPATPQT